MFKWALLFYYCIWNYFLRKKTVMQMQKNILFHKIYILIYKKVKVKKAFIYLFFFFTFSHFSVFFLFFQRFSSICCYVKQFLSGLHLFLRRFFSVFFKRALHYLQKSQVRNKVFNKKLFWKFLGSLTQRVDHEISAKFRSGFFLVNVSRKNYWIFFSFGCELMVNYKNTQLLLYHTFAHLLDLFNRKFSMMVIFINRNLAFADWTKWKANIHQVKIFYLHGFFRWIKSIRWAIENNYSLLYKLFEFAFFEFPPGVHKRREKILINNYM